jgi:hypothetical protein
MSKLQEHPSALKREHRLLHKIKFINFFYVCGHFCPPGYGSRLRIRVRIRIQGPHWIWIQSRSGYGSGSTALVTKSASMVTLGKGLSPDRLQFPETVERTVLFRKRLKSKKEL